MSRKFKHPEADHWLKKSGNHLMANRTRVIENNTKFAAEEQWDLLRVFASVFALGIVNGQKRFSPIVPQPEVGTFGELLYEAL